MGLSYEQKNTNELDEKYFDYLEKLDSEDFPPYGLEILTLEETAEVVQRIQNGEEGVGFSIF